MDISNKGKGAIPTPANIKATHLVLGALLTKTPDWEKGYQVESGFTVVQTDQGAKLICTAEGTSYYGEALNIRLNGVSERYSRRFIYSQSYAPEGGAYIWKAMSIPVIKGFASLASVPELLTELGARDATANDKAVIEAVAYKYAQLPNTGIDYLAGIVEQYGGFVTGFLGNDAMFLPDGTVTVPHTVDWGHCVWVCGYEIRNGKKVLRFKNSWSAQWGDNGYGYFTEEFVNTAYIFDAYVYAELKDIQMTKQVVKLANSQDVYLVETGRKFRFPDYETFAYFRDQLKVVAEPEIISNGEFDHLLEGLPIASQPVGRKMAELYPTLKDAYENNTG